MSSHFNTLSFQAAGYQNLIEKLELYEFSFGLTLFFDIFFHGIPVGSFADRCDIIPIGPKFATPKLFLYRWLMSK
jgi:hypothetical protein